MKVLKQLVSLSISMGCTLVLQCVAFWIEVSKHVNLFENTGMYMQVKNKPSIFTLP